MPGNAALAKDLVASSLRESADVKLALIEQADIIVAIADVWSAALRRGNKILFCGNGGSAADSQHLAAELVGRFEVNRSAYSAIALTTDTSILTAVANDFAYHAIFERQVEAHGRPGDVLVGLSTSGRSENVIRAVKLATERDMRTVAFCGMGGDLVDLAELSLRVGSSNTARIQESHITAGHIICSLVERELAGESGATK